MIRAHKIRLNPTIEQKTYFRKACGTARFVYNQGLDLWKFGKEVGIEDYGVMAIKRDLNSFKAEQFPWMLEVSKSVVEGALMNLGKALNNYFDSKHGKRKGVKVGFPNYKGKKSKHQSFYLANDQFWVDGHNIKIPKLGLVNMAESLRFDGKIMGATVSMQAEWWFVSIQVEVEDPPPIQFRQASVGVDVGIKTLATLSDGSVFENQKPLRSEINKLRKLNRSLSRRQAPTKTQKASKRWWKAKRKLSRFHCQIANRRADFQHKASCAIASTYAFVGVEDLHVTGLMRNGKLALAVSDAGLGEFLRQIQYKSAALGGQVVKVNRFFASSKTCNDCGYVNRSLELKDRTWTCQGCGVIHDRDFNAALNIEQEALRLIA